MFSLKSQFVFLFLSLCGAIQVQAGFTPFDPTTPPSSQRENIFTITNFSFSGTPGARAGDVVLAESYLDPLFSDFCITYTFTDDVLATLQSGVDTIKMDFDVSLAPGWYIAVLDANVPNLGNLVFETQYSDSGFLYYSTGGASNFTAFPHTQMHFSSRVYYPGQLDSVAPRVGFFSVSLVALKSAEVPEPCSMAIFGVGVLGLATCNYRRRKRMLHRSM